MYFHDESYYTQDRSIQKMCHVGLKTKSLLLMRQSVLQVWQEAITVVNDVVLEGLAICLTDRSAMDKLLTAGAAARRGISVAGCRWLQDDIVRLSSSLSDLLKCYAPDGIREKAMSLFTAIEWVWVRPCVQNDFNLADVYLLTTHPARCLS